MHKHAKLVLGISIVGILIFIALIIIVYVVGAGKAGDGFVNVADSIYNIPAETAPGETFTAEDGAVLCRVQIGNEVVPINLDSLNSFKKFKQDKTLQTKLVDLCSEPLKYKSKTFKYDMGVCSIETKNGMLIIDTNVGVVFFEEKSD